MVKKDFGIDKGSVLIIRVSGTDLRVIGVLPPNIDELLLQPKDLVLMTDEQINHHLGVDP